LIGKRRGKLPLEGDKLRGIKSLRPQGIGRNLVACQGWVLEASDGPEDPPTKTPLPPQTPEKQLRWSEREKFSPKVGRPHFLPSGTGKGGGKGMPGR